MNTVGDFLKHLGLSEHLQAFTDHALDWKALPQLTAQDLQQIGITSPEHQKQLLKGISEFTDIGIVRPIDQLTTTGADQQGERRQLTVLFCDLVESTALLERYGLEQMRSILATYRNCCRQVISGLGGSVVSHSGDGLMAYFGHPAASEHDAERAVRAGLDILTALPQLETVQGLALRARIGIATGEVVIGSGATGELQSQDLAVGQTPNLASRMQSLAEPDCMVVSDTTRQLVAGLFQISDLGLREIKGFSQPHHVWRVLGRSSIESRFEAVHADSLSAPLIGRDQELQTLLQHWSAALQGEGRSVILSGQAGIGKSRLLHSLRKRITDRNCVILRYFGSPYHTHTAYYPIIEQVSNAAGFSGDDKQASMQQKLETFISSHGGGAEEIAILRPLLSLTTKDDRGTDPPPASRELTMNVLLKWIVTIAKSNPLLIFVEDLHWIDHSSLEFIGKLVDTLDNLSMMVVMTQRPEFTPSWREHRNISSLSLKRLPQHQIMDIVSHIADGPRLPAAVAEHILDQSDGIPLFAEELTKTILEAGLLENRGDSYVLTQPLTNVAIPMTLQDSLMARLDWLAPWKEVAQTASVIGRKFSFDLLQALFPGESKALAEALERLSEAGLIVTGGSSAATSHTFKHALVRDAAYASLLKAKRKKLHLRLARTLEQQFPAVADAEPELIAQHYSNAGESLPAVDLWLKAAKKAAGRSANVEATQHLNTGLEILLDLPKSVERDRRELEFRTHMGALLTAMKGFAAQEVELTFKRARLLSGKLQNKGMFPILRGLWVHYLVRANWTSARRLAKEMLSLALAENNRSYELEANRALGMTFLWFGKLEAAAEQLQEGWALYDSEVHRQHLVLYGNDPGVACLVHHAMVAAISGRSAQSLQLSDQAISLARELSHPFSLCQAMIYRTYLYQIRRDSTLTLEWAHKTEALATQHDFPFWLAETKLFRGWAHAQLGEPASGLEEMLSGLSDFLDTGALMDRPRWLSMIAEGFQLSGQPDQALKHLAEALELANRTKERLVESLLYNLTGEVHAQTGAANASEEAEKCFTKALRVARRQRARCWELRAATNLAQMRRNRVENTGARKVLQSVCGLFETNDLSTDIVLARCLLRKIS